MTGMGNTGARAVSVVLCGVLLAGCTSSKSGVAPAVISSTVASSDSAAPPTTPVPTPQTSKPAPAAVPVDRIPAGHPLSWIPAGVPATAKYREPGDVVPKFSPTMFTNTSAGALAMARYYIEARNWAQATNDATAFSIICDASKCAHDIPFFVERAAANQHAVGGRFTTGPPVIFTAPANTNARWVTQFTSQLSTRKVISPTGKTVNTAAGYTIVENIYLKWSGSIWRVTGDSSNE